MRGIVCACACLATTAAAEDSRQVYLSDGADIRLAIATVQAGADGSYELALNDAVFTDHFLSMRPFRCLEGEERTLCHVPYPYEIVRNLSEDLVDLEYDLLFVWKGRTDYGIDMWNGLYWVLEEAPDGQLQGTLHEMDMDLLSAPPASGDLRPIRDVHLEPADPDGHWLPILTVESR